MEDKSIWPPPPTNQIQPEQPNFNPFLFLRIPALVLFFRMPALAVGIGLGLALLDIMLKDNTMDLLSMGAAAFLGYKQPMTFWLSAFILTACLYVVHVVAIMHGVRPPFVERNVDMASYSWITLYSNGLCGLVGAVVGYFSKRK